MMRKREIERKLQADMLPRGDKNIIHENEIGRCSILAGI
jgi:hypothetical protein